VRALPTLLSAVVVLGAAAQQTAVRDAQPILGTRGKPVLTVNGLRFKDANGSGTLDAYEDWRLDADTRARDLVATMTNDEKAGLMLIDTLNPDVGGVRTPQADEYLRNQQMRRFIFRSVVTATSGRRRANPRT